MLLAMLVLLDSILQMQLFQINQSEDSSKITIMSDTTCVQLHQCPITTASLYPELSGIFGAWNYCSRPGDEDNMTIWRGCMRHNSWWLELETRAQTGALHTMHVLAGRMELGGRRGGAGECLQKSGQAEWRHDGGNYQELHSWNFSCAQDHMRSPPEEPHLAVRLKFLQGFYHMQLGEKF